MANLKKETSAITTVLPPKEEVVEEPMVEVQLPALEESGDGGLKVDQFEHVTIANEKGEKIFYIHRGERVPVPVSVFMVLKQKYPNI